jgi:hypothetical protein
MLLKRSDVISSSEVTNFNPALRPLSSPSANRAEVVRPAKIDPIGEIENAQLGIEHLQPGEYFLASTIRPRMAALATAMRAPSGKPGGDAARFGQQMLHRAAYSGVEVAEDADGREWVSSPALQPPT